MCREIAHGRKLAWGVSHLGLEYSLLSTEFTGSVSHLRHSVFSSGRLSYFVDPVYLPDADNASLSSLTDQLDRSMRPSWLPLYTEHEPQSASRLTPVIVCVPNVLNEAPLFDQRSVTIVPIIAV